MANTTGKSAWSNSGAFFVALFRRQRGTVVDGQIPLAFQAVEPQRYLVGMLPRGGDTTEVCIIRVPVRHGQAFAVDDFVGWRALVQGEPQPERQDLPVGVEGRDNVYSFGHTDHLYFIIQTYVRKINRENSDLGKTKNGLLIFLGAATAPLTAKQTVMIDLRDTIKTTYGISYIAATFVSLRTNLPGIIQNSSDCGIFYFYNGTDITYNQVVFDYIAIGN